MHNYRDLGCRVFINQKVEALQKGNANGGWHTAKGGKGDGKGVGRHKGGDSITESINRLLATKPK